MLFRSFDKWFIPTEYWNTRNFESAEIDKKEAIEIKENAEKEIEDMKRQFKDDSFDLRIKTMEQRNTIDDQTREISRIDSELEEKSKKLQESEEAVMNTLKDRGKSNTFLIVTHKMDTLKMCDRVYELSNSSFLKRDISRLQ